MNTEINEIELRSLDLNLLPVFCALVRTRSVKKVAEHLGLGPPAVSMALGRLREMTGDPLFVRGRAGLEPTQRALALAQQIGPALDDLRSAILGQAAFDPANSTRTFRFAAPDDLENYLLPILIKRVALEAPGASFIVRAADYKVVRTLLDTGEADVGLTALPPGFERRFKREIVQKSETFLALFDAKNLGFKPGDVLTLEKYLSVPHILRSPSGDLRGLLDEVLEAQGQRRRVAVSVARFTAMPYLLNQIPAIANVPSTTARHFAREFNLEAHPLPLKNAPTFDISLVWSSKSDADSGLKWFRSVVIESMRRLSASL